MRSLVFITCFAVVANVNAQLLPNFGGQRAGLSALSFLKNDLSPISFAQGGASIASKENYYSAISNPAALSLLRNNGLALSNMSVGAGIHQSYAVGAIKSSNNGTLGFNINSLNSGRMEVRTEFEPNGTGQYFFANNTAVGVSYAQKLSDRFNLGIGLKYIYEGISEYTNHTLTADIGFLYTTDFKDLTFAVVIKNFGGNSQFHGTELESSYNRTLITLEKYTTPTVFKMGFSFVPYKDDNKTFRVAAELNHPNDNAENIRIGGELSFKELLYLRTGYKLSVKGQHYPTFGIGFKTRLGRHPLLVDYGINPTNSLGTQHIFGLQVPFNLDKR